MEGRLYLGLQFQRESPHGEAWLQAADQEAERSNLQEKKKKTKQGKQNGKRTDKAIKSESPPPVTWFF